MATCSDLAPDPSRILRGQDPSLARVDRPRLPPSPPADATPTSASDLTPPEPPPPCVSKPTGGFEVWLHSPVVHLHSGPRAVGSERHQAIASARLQLGVTHLNQTEYDPIKPPDDL